MQEASWKETQRKGGSRAKGRTRIHVPFCADGSVKLTGRDQEVGTSTFIQDHPVQGEEDNDVLQEKPTSLNRQANKRMTPKPDMIYVVFL